jgi:hypothetical protein
MKKNNKKNTKTSQENTKTESPVIEVLNYEEPISIDFSSNNVSIGVFQNEKVTIIQNEQVTLKKIK